jgi:hypothetical protein
MVLKNIVAKYMESRKAQKHEKNLSFHITYSLSVFGPQ